MFASAAPSSLPREADDHGFTVSRGRVTFNALRARLDDMAIFYVVAGAILLAILVPAWQAVQVTPTVPRAVAVETAAAKGDRLRRPALDIACSGVTYGSETAECLVAIARERGRDGTHTVRIVEFGAGNG